MTTPKPTATTPKVPTRKSRATKNVTQKIASEVSTSASKTDSLEPPIDALLAINNSDPVQSAEFNQPLVSDINLAVSDKLSASNKRVKTSTPSMSASTNAVDIDTVHNHESNLAVISPDEHYEANLIAPTNDDTKADLALLDRDASLLAFNLRVLDWAKRKDVPLLERVKYLCIVSNNLDEFFEVRVAPHLSKFENSSQRSEDHQSAFENLMQQTAALVAEQYSVFNDHLFESLNKEGIKILPHGKRDSAQRKWVKTYFQNEVRPLLLPVGLDPAHPFPIVANKSLNFIVKLGGKDAFGRQNDIAIVKVPRVLPRLIALPAKMSGKQFLVVTLSSVIRAHLEDLFPGREVLEFSQFRVTRNSDLSVDDDDVENLRMALRRGLEVRNFGQAVRLEVSAGCPTSLSDFLLKQFKLPNISLFRVHGPVNLGRLMQLVDLADREDLLFSPFKSKQPAFTQKNQNIFDQLKQGDILIHQPFESFDGVLHFLREAVYDPDVLAIRQTIYRTGTHSELMDLLREAVRRGKEVLAVVELKARFDEEANINWAEMLEAIGAQVVYGVVGLKTHAKMLSITRRENNKLMHYCHLSTGNYNAKTAKLYTDFSHITADPEINSDMTQVFGQLASLSKMPPLKQLWVAPFTLHKKIVEALHQLSQTALAGMPAKAVIKMNSLTDIDLIKALVQAGQAGVEIDLIIRGACMLAPQVPGLTDNIRVRSVIGRFLEHSRVFYFVNNGLESLYLSSADWMNRNMLRRVETAWPVNDPVLRKKIVDEALDLYLQDNTDAWLLDSKGVYTRCTPPVVGKLKAAKISAQTILMKIYS